MTVLSLIVWLVVLGVVAWIVSLAPFVEATFKKFITYVLLVIGAIMVISFLLGILDGGTIGDIRLR